MTKHPMTEETRSPNDQQPTSMPTPKPSLRSPRSDRFGRHRGSSGTPPHPGDLMTVGHLRSLPVFRGCPSLIRWEPFRDRELRVPDGLVTWLGLVSGVADRLASLGWGCRASSLRSKVPRCYVIVLLRSRPESVEKRGSAPPRSLGRSLSLPPSAWYTDLMPDSPIPHRLDP